MSLDSEREGARVVPLANEAGPEVPLAKLPDSPGLYTLWARSGDAIEELGLSQVEGFSPLLARPLYLGKAEDSLAKRVARKHFVSGNTGHSTARRTFAALLDLQSTPRKSRLVNPTPKQLRTMTTNFGLTPDDDDRLTSWLRENLVVKAAPTRWAPLRELEHAVGAILQPTLDQERRPMWSPNPWREQVAACRKCLQARARAAAGLAEG